MISTGTPYLANFSRAEAFSINSTVDTLFIKFEINKQVFVISVFLFSSSFSQFDDWKENHSIHHRRAESHSSLFSFIFLLSTNPRERILPVNWRKAKEKRSRLCLRAVWELSFTRSDSIHVLLPQFSMFSAGFRQSVHFLITSFLAFLYLPGEVCFPTERDTNDGAIFIILEN